MGLVEIFSVVPPVSGPEPPGVPINFWGFETLDTIETASVHPGTGGSITVQGAVTAGDWSAGALKVAVAAGDTNFVLLGNLSSSGDENVTAAAQLYLSFKLRVDLLPVSGDEQCFWLGNRLSIRVNSSGQFTAYDSTQTLIGTSTAAITAGQWYPVGIYGTGTDPGYWEVRLNGFTVISGTSTLGGGPQLFFISLGVESTKNGNAVTYYFDDLIADAATYHDGTKVSILVPNADGFYTNGTPNGAANRWQCVDELPNDGDTTFVALGGSGQVFTSTVGANSNISGVVLVAKAYSISRVAAGSCNTKTRLRSAGVDADTLLNKLVGTVYNKNGRIFATDPATGSPWTVSAVQAVEVGAIQNSATALQTTGTWVTVAYK